MTAVDVKLIGTVAIELTYKDSAGRLGNELIYRDREPTIEVGTVGKPWSFDGDGAMFRLVIAWPEITKLAQAAAGGGRARQMTLDEEG